MRNKAISAGILLMLAIPPPSWTQIAGNPADPSNAPFPPPGVPATGEPGGEGFVPRGFQFMGLTLSSMYSSGSYGIGLGAGYIPNQNDRNVVIMQAGTGVGWSHRGLDSALSFDYSPSYVRGLRLSNYSAFNHSLSFGGTRTLWAKWTLGASIRGILNDFNQLLFAPTDWGRLAGTPATFDDLAGAVTGGVSANPDLTVLTGGARIVNSPESAFAYGSRHLSTSAAVSLSYAQTPRSTWGVSLSAMRNQNMLDQNTAGNVGPGLVVPKTTAGNADVSWSYALSPRTNFSVSTSTGRTFSRFQDAYVSRAGIGFGRKLTRSWFAHFSAGAGKIIPLRDTLGVSRGVQHEMGAGIGYKFRAHTFLASYARAVSDLYGLGADATESSGGAWNWKRPGSSFSLSSSFGHSRLIGRAFKRPASWMANAGAGKALGTHVTVSLAFTYTEYPEALLLASGTRAQKGVVLSLGWRPGAIR